MGPLRIIFSDTATGETDYSDVAVSEFTPEACIEHLKQALCWTTEHDPMFMAAWVLAMQGETACFIVQTGEFLIHGVCYTRFDPRHNPFS